MIDDRDLIRHLQEGGPELWERPDPPALDLAAITGASASRAPRAARTWSVRPLVALAGAAACIALGGVGGAALFGGAGEPPSPVVASNPQPTGRPQPTRIRQVALNRFGDAAPLDAAAQASVFTASDGRTVDLRVHGLPVPRKGEFYELWMLGDAGKMVSLGVVRVDASGAAEARMPLPVSRRRFPVFDISLEPGDGNPTHSGHSVLRSATA